MPRPSTHTHTHQRSPGGRWPRSTSTVTRAIAQAALITAVTTWSLASSGGGAGRSFLLTWTRLAGPRVVYLIHATATAAPPRTLRVGGLGARRAPHPFALLTV